MYNLGLNRIKELLFRLGNPQDDLRIVHIGGTNGKGSVVSYLEHIAIAAGVKCGAYTSPALASFCENVRIGGLNITQEDLYALNNIINSHCDAMVQKGLDCPTEFEKETALALLHFKNKKCDIVFLEVGLGSEGDATNAVGDSTILTIFTSIGIDHIEHFGTTIESNAKAELSIIKPSVPVIICANQDKAVLKAIEGYPHTVADIYSGKLKSKAVFAPINAGLAQATARQLGFSDSAIAKGLAAADWFGRFSVIAKKPTIILDGAHNVSAVNALVDSLKATYKNKKIIFIVKIKPEKQAKQMLEVLEAVSSIIINLNDYGCEINALVEVFCACDSDSIIVATGSLSHLNNILNSYKFINNIIDNPLYIKCIDSIEQLEKNREFCKHNSNHFFTTAKLALKEWRDSNNSKDLENLEQVKIITATALLHDIGKHQTVVPHNIEGATLAKQILLDSNIGFKVEQIEQICNAILTHNDKSVINDNTLNGIIYRADKVSRACNTCNARPKCKNHKPNN